MSNLPLNPHELVAHPPLAEGMKIGFS